MKFILKTALLASAVLAVGGIACSASAGTLEYTFKGFCDGLTLTQDGVTYGGTHTGCTAGDAAGGVIMRVKGNSTTYVDVATSDSLNAPGVVLTYFLDVPAKTWFLYETQGGVFSDIISGKLKKGAPESPRGLHSTADAASKPARPVNGPF